MRYSDFGAKGDGRTNDIEALIRAHEYANERGVPVRGDEGAVYYISRVEAGAVGMIGCKRNKLGFMRGYDAMLEKLSPSKILCFGTPFREMAGNIVTVDYMQSRKAVR